MEMAGWKIPRSRTMFNNRNGALGKCWTKCAAVARDMVQSQRL